MLVRRRVEQAGEVGGKPDLRDHDRAIGLGRQGLAQHRRCARGVVESKVMWIAEAIAVFLIDQ